MKTATLAVGDQTIERQLARVAESFRFILDVTPVNVEEQRREFLRGGLNEPAFAYRELDDDPAVLASTLDQVEIEAVEDVSLRGLLEAKRRELDLQLAMLRARGTPKFRLLSQDLYGTVSTELLQHATTVLDSVEPTETTGPECIEAVQFAALAESELSYYRSAEPDIGVHVEIRPDVAGVMVSGNVLLVSSAACIRTSRVDAVLQHEVGTHLLTYVNGSFQPIRMLATGLAGYEATQEGLAVVAEFLVGGLSRFRLRQLAARVVAAHRMVAGEPFRDVFTTLINYEFSARSAFTTTMRAFRAGGLTKDAIYLRGLLDLLTHLHNNGRLDNLWLGKLSLSDLPLVDELSERGVLMPPRLLPRYLNEPATPLRLAEAATLADLSKLVGAIT